MSGLLLGIDIGTSACKAAVFTPQGRPLAQASQAYSIDYPQPGWAEQHPDTWWAAACFCVRSLLDEGVKPQDILGIAVSGQSWAAVAVDSAGQVLLPSPLWTDSRAQAECADIRRLIPEETLFALSGNPLQPGYTFPKILWYKRHRQAAYERASAILQSNSFIAYRLSGALSQDRSQGYGLICYDIRKGAWDKALCQALGVRPELLPPLYDSHEQVGTLTQEAAAATGLLAGTPVFAGGLDAACGTLGVGVIAPGQAQEQGGQAGGMSLCTDAASAHPKLILGHHAVPGRWLLQGGTTGGGGALKWFREAFCPQLSFARMDALAAQVPAGCEGLSFLPYLAGERSPLWEPGAKGVFYGLDYAKGLGHLIRAVMEGVAFSLRHNLETAAQAGLSARVLRATGGSANSALWVQMKADITGCLMEVPAHSADAALGAALLAGVGAGVYDGFEGAVAAALAPGRAVPPDASQAPAYAAAYARYLELVRRLVPMMADDQKNGVPS